MKKITKILLVLGICSSIALSTLADGGIGRKSRNKVSLNIATPSTLKNAVYINLRSGLKYTGSLLVSQQSTVNSIFSNTLITFEKGNTVYIIPYRHVITMPDIRPGYTGMKIIIRPH